MVQFLDFRKRPATRPTVSAEDRALIDAALSAGKVTVVETGASSFPGYVWDGYSLALRKPKGRQRAAAFNARAAEEAMENRRRIEQMAARGLSASKIAEATGLHVNTVTRHISAARSEVNQKRNGGQN